MTKKNILLLVLIIVLVLLVGGYLYWQKIKAHPDKELKAAPTPIPPSAKGTLPKISPVSNPLEKAPEINPVEKANPFTDIYKNPFK